MMGLEQGDAIEVNFDPTVGHEPQKVRPAVVISSYEFNAGSSLTVIAPITTVDNGYPLHIRIGENNEVSGFVCIEQLRSMDLTKRKAKRIGALDDTTMLTVMSHIRGVFNL
jgi:mRNA interferase MazF